MASGPAIKPMMLRAVFEVARAVPDVPILAVGGIRSGEDAIEAMLAGAWAVQVGTAVLIDPEAPVADRPGGRPVPEGQGPRVARRRPWAPAGARVVRRPRGGGRPVIPRPENPLIVALDVSDLGEAERLAAMLAPHVGMLKVGLELFWAHGPDAVRRIASHGPGVRGREAARHPEDGRTSRGEHRPSRRRRC